VPPTMRRTRVACEERGERDLNEIDEFTLADPSGARVGALDRFREIDTIVDCREGGAPHLSVHKALDRRPLLLRVTCTGDQEIRVVLLFTKEFPCFPTSCCSNDGRPPIAMSESLARRTTALSIPATPRVCVRTLTTMHVVIPDEDVGAAPAR
jgi:hypothetical protein